MRKAPIVTSLNLETQINGYIVQTSGARIDLSNRPVVSTSVFYRKKIQEKEQIVYVSSTYKSLDCAVKGHQKIVKDLESHPEKYTVERWARIADKLMKPKR